MSQVGDTEFTKRHPDDEFVDRVEIKVIPRYKTSGLSGDEWRVHAELILYRKGEVVFSRGFKSVEVAAAALPWFLLTWYEENGLTQGPGWQDNKCGQPGCSEPATNKYQLKREWAPNGEGPLPPASFAPVRRFCDRHARRGDCALEDADMNYTVLEGNGPAGAKPKASDESQSAFDCVFSVTQAVDMIEDRSHHMEQHAQQEGGTDVKA